jgi:hypothetical protein
MLSMGPAFALGQNVEITFRMLGELRIRNFSIITTSASLQRDVVEGCPSSPNISDAKNSLLATRVMVEFLVVRVLLTS